MRKPAAWLLYGIHICAFSATAFATYYWRSDVAEKYRSLRPGLFSGFLTMTGFAMTMKAYVMVNVAKAIHDSKQARAVNETMAQYGIEADVYEPLEQLRDFLVVPVGLCLLAAIAQVTFGLRDSSVWCMGIALCLAANGAASIVGAIWMMRYAMSAWINLLRRETPEDNTASETEHE